MTDKDKRTGWLRELKVGDKVFYRNSHYREVQPTTVTKITPTGRITTADFSTFDHNGARYPYQKYYYGVLAQWTEEGVAEIKTKQMISSLKSKIMGVMDRRNHIDFEVDELAMIWHYLRKYEKKGVSDG